jgi:hypothetical protein
LPKFRDSHSQTELEKATRQSQYGNYREFFSGQQKCSPVSRRRWANAMRSQMYECSTENRFLFMANPPSSSTTFAGN